MPGGRRPKAEHGRLRRILEGAKDHNHQRQKKEYRHGKHNAFGRYHGKLLFHHISTSLPFRFLLISKVTELTRIVNARLMALDFPRNPAEKDLYT